jgi:hypothetical protein
MISKLLSATTIYRNLDDPIFQTTNLESNDYFFYSKAISNFFHSIEEIQYEDEWKGLRRKLRRLLFLLTSAPLNNEYLSIKLDETAAYIEWFISDKNNNYPSLCEDVSIILNYIVKISQTEVTITKRHFDEKISELKGNIAIVLKDTKLIPIIESIYSQDRFSVCSINSIKSLDTFDYIFCFGPINRWWFPEYISSSGRAKNIETIKYIWQNNYYDTQNHFCSPLKPITVVKNENPINISPSDSIPPDLSLPSININEIIESTWNSSNDLDKEIELVEALVLQLENDNYSYIDKDENSKVQVIDLENEIAPVQKISTNQLEKDMYILLKTSGGGDYIIPLANKILGPLAEKCRKSQTLWKQKLRKLVYENGKNWVINQLLQHGCSIANNINLSNWTSYRAIKTNKVHHFLGIMEVIGLKNEGKTIWKEMNLIFNAHLKAGRIITKELIAGITVEDLEELQKMGELEFELPDKDAGSITAFRIIAISDTKKSVLVPESKLGIPYRID